MINILSNNLFLFIDTIASKLADRCGRSTFAILSYFLSSGFIYIIITTIGEGGKKQVRKESDLGIIEADHKTWEGVDRHNGIKTLPANWDVLASVDKDIPILADR